MQPLTVCAQHSNMWRVIIRLTAASDEIDAIATKRETAQREMERRIVAQMLTCMDDLSAPAASAQTETVTDTTAVTTAGQASSDAQQTETASKHVVIIGKICFCQLRQQ